MTGWRDSPSCKNCGHNQMDHQHDDACSYEDGGGCLCRCLGYEPERTAQGDKITERPELPAPKLRYSWQRAVFDALWEYRPDQIRSKRIAADLAISERLRQRPQDVLELLALRDAMFTLELVFAENKPNTESMEKKETA